MQPTLFDLEVSEPAPKPRHRRERAKVTRGAQVSLWSEERRARAVGFLRAVIDGQVKTLKEYDAAR
jgi:hypothetical protein